MIRAAFWRLLFVALLAAALLLAGCAPSVYFAPSLSFGSGQCAGGGNKAPLPEAGRPGTLESRW